MPKQGVLATYLAYARLAATNSAEIYHLGSAIPVLLNELNLRGFTVEGIGDSGQSKPLSVFSLLLGPSGDGKSTGATTAINHICSILESEDEANSGVQARARRLEFDGTPEGLRYALISRFYHEDLKSTIALLYHEELTSLFARGSSHTAEFLQRLYDGRSIVEQQRQHQRAVSETGIDNSSVKNPRVNALFCSTPDNLSHVLTKTMASGGMYGRLLIFVGEARPAPYEGHRFALREKTEEANHTSELAISEWSSFLDAATITHGSRQIKISDAAHVVFENWHDEHQELIHATNAEDNLRSMVARATRSAWTIAGLYATTQFRMAVSAQDAEEACKLVDRCIHMGKVLDRRLGQSEESRLLDAIYAGICAAGKKGLPLAKVYDLSGVAGRVGSRFMVKEMLETLIEANKVTRTLGPKPARGPIPQIFYMSEIAVELEVSQAN